MAEIVTLPPGETSKQSLIDVVDEAFLPLRLFLDILRKGQGDECSHDVELIMRTLYDRATADIEKAFRILQRDVGEIKFSYALYGNSKGLPAGEKVSCHMN